MIPFRLPSLGADMDEGKLLEWHVKPGDAVRRGQVVALIDTSKAAVDVEIWDEGTVHALLVQPGETIPVGTLLATLLAPGETPETATPIPPEPARPAVRVVSAAGTLPPAAAVRAGELTRRRVSPAARKHAADVGVNVDEVAGTGPEGAVTIEDVEKAVAAMAAPKDRQAEMRKAIAAAMSRSKREIPHYYLADAVPLAAASAWLAQENAKRPVTGRLLMAVLFLKAVALACKDFPDMNGLFREGRFEPGTAVHAGVAISLRQGGLIAPAIHDAGAKTLAELMRDLTDLVKRARAGSLRSSEMSDPTITVTNLGEEGVDSVHGVIYPPQVALVGFGRVSERPWVEQGVVRGIPLVTASLAADHRVSDGHRGALFLARVRMLLQDPQNL